MLKFFGLGTKRSRKTRTRKQRHFSGGETDEAKKIVAGKIYANWCVHCRNLALTWEKLKEDPALKSLITFIDIEDAQLEPRREEVKKTYGVELISNSYPTIYRFETDKQTPIYYEGAREFAPLKKWLLNGTVATATSLAHGRLRRRKSVKKNKQVRFSE